MNTVYILFITRNYPPQLGGMESYSFDLYNTLKNDVEIDLLSNSRGKLFLPYFIIKCILYILINRTKYTHIHFGDAVLSPLAYISGILTNSKISLTVHALDVIYNNYIYQLIITRCLSRVDKIVAVSHYVKEQCLLRGINKDQCYLIPNGINYSNNEVTVSEFDLVLSKYAIKNCNKKILFSVGRLIKRKGINWFVGNVMPLLGKEYVYVIAGDGPEYQSIQKTIQNHKLEEDVYLLGRISDAEKFCLFTNSFLYLMPNISVDGDAEGFGITIIEAASFGLPAIASKIEGIPDTIVENETGTLVNQSDTNQFIHAIKNAVFDKARIKQLVKERYDWSILKGQYIKLIFC